MLKKCFALMIITLLIVTCCYVSICEARDIERRDLYIVAVSRLENGSFVGVYAKLRIAVEYPGSGIVYISTKPLTQLDIQASARVAAITAAQLTGIDYFSRNYYIYVEAPSPIVGGPSASAAMAVAIAAAILRVPINSSVIMTGMINPDGTVGPVGGIVYKLEAAKKAGAKLFLIPAGQRYDYRVVVRKESLGPITIEKIEREKVDIIEYGKKLSIEVREVVSIAEALQYFTGISLNLSIGEVPKLPEVIEYVIKSWYESLKTEYLDLKSSVEALIDQAPHNVKVIVNRLIEASNKNFEEASRLMKHNKFYAAASTMFIATYRVLTALYIIRASSEGAERAFEIAISKANESINFVLGKLDRCKARNTYDLSVLSASQARLIEAMHHMDLAINNYREGSIVDALANLAFAKLRAETSGMWLDLLGLSNGSCIDLTTVREISSALLYNAETVYSYAELLISESSYQSSGATALLTEAENCLEMAKRALDMNMSFAVLELSARASSLSTAAIHMVFSAAMDRVAEAVMNYSKYWITQASRVGAYVVGLLLLDLASMYFDYSDYSTAILYSTLAITIAQTALMASKTSTTIFTTTTSPTRIPKEVITTTITTTTTTTETITITKPLVHNYVYVLIPLILIIIIVLLVLIMRRR